VPGHCISLLSRILRTNFRLWTPVLFVALALVLSSVNTARAAAFTRFSIDLDRVGKLYDTLYRDRLTDEIDVDSVVVYDFQRTQLGRFRSTVPQFLTSDVSTTREVVDYLSVPGYRVTTTVPRAAYFEPTQRQAGELILVEPRDYSIPDLSVEFATMDDVATEVLQESRRKMWNDSVRGRLSAMVATTQPTTGGITFNIPVPMPKSLESIFGPGEKTSITLRGREQITIAGKTTVMDPFIGVEGRQEQSLFPSLDMQQQLDVNLTGTIGDKVSIQVDHSSEAITDDANRVRLAYTGYEDEVIQLIELGNTSLSLPGSQLVSISTSAQGLFGAKMLAKMGATDITMIASKQEGEVSSSTFSPSAGGLGETELREIRDVDYVRNKYFYFNSLDTPNQDGIRPQAQSIQLWRARGINPPPGPETQGWVIPDPDGTGASLRALVDSLNTGITPEAEPTRFELLQLGVDYAFILDSQTDEILGLELFEAIPVTALKSLGVLYTNTDGQAVGGTYASMGVTGDNTDGSKNSWLLLKMLKAPDPDPNGIYGSTWDLEIRNIYNLGLTNIDRNSLKIEIIDRLDSRLNPQFPNGSEVPYIRIFGLDRTDVTGTGPPDGLIDLTRGIVNLDFGLLQFPTTTPFAPDTALVSIWTQGGFQFTGPYLPQWETSQAIYNEKLSTQREQQVHQYLIKVEAVSTSKSFRINALNIVPNSEKIFLDGQELARGGDYEINYDTGEVTLKDPAIARITPDSRINVTYEFKPLGGIASSTLAGMSTASKLFGENARLGTTFLYESRATSTDKARLGEEPSRAFVAGLTAGYQHQSRILTDIANWLPFVDSDQPSTITIDGELAASFPNPNTKNEAYIDDFEGVEDTDRIGFARRSWYPASLPVQDNGFPKPDTSRVDFLWYNIEPELGLHRRDLNPDLNERENTLLQSLDLELMDDPVPGDSTSYAGIMLGFQGGGLDLTQGQFIEIWVNDFKPDTLSRGGKLHIDLGIIDENFHNPQLTDFDDEDKDKDGFAATFDDTGLDELFNDEETLLPGGTPEDPAGDDIDLSRINGRFLKVNGTEANLLYDTEDLDRNGQLNTVNAYFSYEIDLADAAEIDIRLLTKGNYDGYNDPGHKNDAWRLYRVRISDNVVRATSGLQPRLDEIRHVRIWFEDLASVVRTDADVGHRRVQIAEFSIEGNRWEIDGVRDLSDALVDSLATEFAIGVISTKTDPGVYNPPVVPNQLNDISDKESSLALRYANLGPGTQVRILKRFLGAGLNMTLYRDLNFWVHTDALRDGVEYYFRMGTNETNYYEVVVPFTNAYYNETGWARVVVGLSDLTNLKFLPPEPDGVVSNVANDLADPTRRYTIHMRGAPNLNGVRFLYAGVRNVNNAVPQSGEIWINDIFVGSVMRDFDHAERLSANFSLAGGAISFGGNWARTGADYRGLRQTRGSGADLTALGLNAKTDLQYFLPLAGFSIPVSLTYTQSKSLPKFPPNSDTEITSPVLSDSLKSLRKTRGFTVSLARRSPSKNPFMKYTIDRMRPTYSYSDSRGISPAVRDTTTNMTGGITYQMTWSGANTIPLLGKNRLRFWINQLDLSTNADRRTGKRWSLINGEYRRDPYIYSATMRNQGTARYNPFRSLETSFGLSELRDLGLDPFQSGHRHLGVQIGYANNMRVSFLSPESWGFMRLLEKPSIEVVSNYNEESGPNVRAEGDPLGTRNVRASRNDTGRLGFDVGKRLGQVFGWMGLDTTQPTQQPPGSGGSGGVGGTGGSAGGPSGGAPPDSLAPPPTQAPPDTSRASGGGGINPIRGVARMLTRIRPIKANVTRRKETGYLRVPERPDWSYQLGLDNNTGILVDGQSIGRPDSRIASLGYNMESGVQLLANLDLQARYTQTITDVDQKAYETRSTTTKWPDMQARWGGLENMRVLRGSIQQGEIRMDYNETMTESGPKGKDPIATLTTLMMSPSLVMMWKNQLNSSLSATFTENTSETSGARTISNNLTLSMELRKTFRGGGGLKLFGKGVSWTNEMEASFSAAYARAAGESFQPGSDVSQPVPKSTSLTAQPNLKYTFSKNISGSAFFTYGRSFAEATGVTTTSVELGVSAVINF
jgi:hypothetical protein